MDIKRLFAWAIIALPLFAACDSGDKINDEGNEEGTSVEVSMKTLAGEWFLNTSDEFEVTEHTLTINSDGSYVEETTMYSTYDDKKEITSQYRNEGTFKLEGSRLYGKVTKAQSRYSRWVDGQNTGLTEWEDNDWYTSYDTVQVSILRNGSLLVLQAIYAGYGQDINAYTSFFFKKGAKLPSDKSELQGTWYWMETGMISDDEAVVRVAVKFTNDNVDMIITPWGARYTGKYTYKDGIVSIGKTTFYTTRDVDGYNDVIDYLHPYDSEWRIPGPDDYYQNSYPDGFSFPFVVNGKLAYSQFVGLAPVYQKQ